MLPVSFFNVQFRVLNGKGDGWEQLIEIFLSKEDWTTVNEVKTSPVKIIRYFCPFVIVYVRN